LLWILEMRDYDPNGDEYERLMYYTDGHPEVWSSEMIREFQRYLRKHHDAPSIFVNLRYQRLVDEQVSELLRVADEFDPTE